MRPYVPVQTPAGPSAASELAQLGAWRRDPHPARTEIDDQDGVILNADNPAEAVLIVCHLVQHGELLGRRSEGRDAEGTCGQERPDSGARMFHHHQYAPFSRSGRLISADSSLTRARLGILRSRTRYDEGYPITEPIVRDDFPRAVVPGPRETLVEARCVDPWRSAGRLGVRSTRPGARDVPRPVRGTVRHTAAATVPRQPRGEVFGSTRPAPDERSPYRPAESATRPPPGRRRVGARPKRA